MASSWSSSWAVSWNGSWGAASSSCSWADTWGVSWGSSWCGGTPVIVEEIIVGGKTYKEEPPYYPPKPIKSIEIQSKIQKKLFEDVLRNPFTAAKYKGIDPSLAAHSLHRHKQAGSPKLPKRVR